MFRLYDTLTGVCERVLDIQTQCHVWSFTPLIDGGLRLVALVEDVVEGNEDTPYATYQTSAEIWNVGDGVREKKFALKTEEQEAEAKTLVISSFLGYHFDSVVAFNDDGGNMNVFKFGSERQQDWTLDDSQWGRKENKPCFSESDLLYV